MYVDLILNVFQSFKNMHCVLLPHKLVKWINSWTRRFARDPANEAG
jgi:hypothetical protein